MGGLGRRYRILQCSEIDKFADFPSKHPQSGISANCLPPLDRAACCMGGYLHVQSHTISGDAQAGRFLGDGMRVPSPLKVAHN